MFQDSEIICHHENSVSSGANDDIITNANVAHNHCSRPNVYIIPYTWDSIFFFVTADGDILWD